MICPERARAKRERDGGSGEFLCLFFNEGFLRRGKSVVSVSKLYGIWRPLWMKLTQIQNYINRLKCKISSFNLPDLPFTPYIIKMTSNVFGLCHKTFNHCS
jgi:hypothetical protein